MIALSTRPPDDDAAARRLWEMETALRRMVVEHARLDGSPCDCSNCHLARYLLGDKLGPQLQREIEIALGAEQLSWERRTELELERLGVRVEELDGQLSDGKSSARLTTRRDAARDRRAAVGHALQGYRLAMKRAGLGTLRPPWGGREKGLEAQTKPVRFLAEWSTAHAGEVWARHAIEHAVATGVWTSREVAESKLYPVLSDKTRYVRVQKGVYRCVTS